MEYIKVNVNGVVNRETGEIERLKVLSVERSSEGVFTGINTYELPMIFYALGRKDVRLPIVENNRFTYKFPFKLS